MEIETGQRYLTPCGQPCRVLGLVCASVGYVWVVEMGDGPHLIPLPFGADISAWQPINADEYTVQVLQLRRVA